MPEQLGSDDDKICGSADESLVFFVLRVGLTVDDEVEYRGSPVWIGDQYFLAKGWRLVKLGGRFLLDLDSGGVESLHEDSGRDECPLGAQLGEHIGCHIVVPEDMVEFQAVEVGF